MIWRQTWQSILALAFLAGAALLVVGFMAYFEVWFLERSWSDPMCFSGVAVILLTFPARLIAWFIDLVMSAFGKPLFYDVQFEMDEDMEAKLRN